MVVSSCRHKPISAPEGTRSDWSFLTLFERSELGRKRTRTDSPKGYRRALWRMTAEGVCMGADYQYTTGQRSFFLCGRV